MHSRPPGALSAEAYIPGGFNQTGLVYGRETSLSSCLEIFMWPGKTGSLVVVGNFK